jgi:hypothetical protein
MERQGSKMESQKSEKYCAEVAVHAPLNAQNAQ